MNEIEIPRVHIPTKGLTDVFAEMMAKAMNVSVEEVKTILEI